MSEMKHFEWSEIHMFQVKITPKPPTKILHGYQAGEQFGLQGIGGDFEVKTKEKIFTTSIFPFLQTDHLFDQIIGSAIIIIIDLTAFLV